MKNLFGLESKKAKANNAAYVIRNLDGAENAVKLNEVAQRNLSARKKACFPFWFLLLSCVFVMAGLILLAIGVPEQVEDFNDTNLVLLIIGGVLSVFGFAVFGINLLRMKKLEANTYYRQSVAEEEKLIDEALKIPDGAERIDVLISDKEKKHPCYRFQTMKIFKENDLLCFSDNCEVTGVPLSQIMTVYKVNGTTVFYTMEEPDKQKRKTCGIRMGRNNTFTIKSKIVAEVQLGGEQLEIVVTGYDGDKFIKYLNKQVVIV